LGTQIWQIADKENRGFLTPAGFGIVLRLIGHAQAGREPTAEVALQPGPVPKFDGITTTPAPPPAPPALQSQGSGGPAPIRIPPLTPEKVAQYSSLFERQTLQNGSMLNGESAKQIFEKSGLPNDVLGRIWMLADTEQRGALVLTEFVIAMHLLTSIKTGALRGLPNILPAALYEAATRRGSAGAGIPRQQSPTTATPPISAIPRQLTGQGPLPQMRTGSPLGRPPIVAQTTGEWLVTPADKVRFDQLYDELDKAKRGFISGEEAVPFFSQSNLSEDALAQIWDLSDIRSEGRLTKDEFAVAMYLIRQQRTKPNGSALPATLPRNLIPPGMRTPQARPATATSAFEPPPPRPQPPQQKPSAMEDLFGLDDIQAPAPAQVPIGTGGSAGGDPFAVSMSPVAPASPARPSPSASNFKPFVPSSSFGRGLTTQVTGGSNGSASARPPAAFDDDLLGDTEPEVSKNLSSETTELANLSNQIGSLTKQVQDVQGQRNVTQNELSQSSAQKKTFEQRLVQLRAMYEKEAQDVRALETQLTTSKNETKKLQAEYAMVDASYQELQNQHRQIYTALQSDQQENANLKEKIRTTNAEIGQLKPQIEKLKSEARQQKGLVAINKKQLATNEGERERLKSETEDLTRSNEELARQISSSSSPVPAPAQVASPALSTASANNPFFRRTGSTDITATFSPPIRSFTDKAFDDVFGPGPVGAGSQAGTPPPPAAAAMFRQNTGTSTGSVGSFATPASTSPNASRQPTITAEPPSLGEVGRSNSGFPHYVDAAESLSTSRQVSPPLSRTETNQEAVASPLEPAQTGQSMASGSGSEARPASPVSQADTKAAFGSLNEESNKGPAAGNEADPFAVDQDKAKEDFESAFASFKQARASPPSGTETAKAFTTFNTEFPPISELERDEESDTESERGGFDDDFSPVSPQSRPVEKTIESRSASPTVSRTSPDAGTGVVSPASPEPAARYA
jgi:epidermal growth factor receptor substrate 15